jgi:hypothetical protein
MTAFAFILGVIPLMLSSGAGAGAQNVMGTGVFWGMLVATFLGVFIIPGNYTFIEGLGRRNKKERGPIDEPQQPPSVVDSNSHNDQHGHATKSERADVNPAGAPKNEVDGEFPHEVQKGV